MKAEPEGSSMHYLVHYAGWNVRYDEWITKERIMSVVELGKPGSVERQNSKSAVSALSSNKSSGKVRWFLNNFDECTNKIVLIVFYGIRGQWQCLS